MHIIVLEGLSHHRLFGSEFEIAVKLYQFKIIALENVAMSLQVTGQRKAARQVRQYCERPLLAVF